MGKHYRGKHRKPVNVRGRVVGSAAVVALGLTAGLIASPAADAGTTSVALQSFNTSLMAPGPTNNRDHHEDGDRGRRPGDRDIRFRLPIRRGHWDNVCGPHRVFVPRLHRTVVENSCSRLWRNF